MICLCNNKLQTGDKLKEKKKKKNLWHCHAIRDIWLHWFGSTCLLRRKGDCKSIQKFFWLITFIALWKHFFPDGSDPFQIDNAHIHRAQKSSVFDEYENYMHHMLWLSQLPDLIRIKHLWDSGAMYYIVLSTSIIFLLLIIKTPTEGRSFVKVVLILPIPYQRLVESTPRLNAACLATPNGATSQYVTLGSIHASPPDWPSLFCVILLENNDTIPNK